MFLHPQRDIVKMLELYQAGRLKLDELVTAKYTLDQVNQGYADLVAGKNIRGVVVHGWRAGRGAAAARR